MNKDDHIDIEHLRILDPDAAAERDEEGARARVASDTGTPPRRSNLVGGSAQPAPRRSQFGATDVGEARFLEARRMHRIGELTEEMGLIEPWPVGSGQRAQMTDDEVAAASAGDAAKAEKARFKREYNRRHKAKHPHRLALAKAKENLVKSKASLENTKGELEKVEAAKVEIKTRPGGEREIELMYIVGKEIVWGNALRKSLQAIEKWERELPALEQAAAQEAAQ
jgi:hypothetical protein